MSTLSIVRHGQASYGQIDYDQLTELGFEQARRLGAWWADRGFEPDRVYVGPCRRHHQTWETAKQAYDERRGEAGDSTSGLVPPVPAPALNEFPAFEVVQYAVPSLARDDPEIAQWLAAMGKPGNEKGTKGLFQRVFERVMRMYVRGELVDMLGSIEPFAAFRQRVEGWLESEVLSAGRGLHFVAFSSGGPVAAAVGRALGLDDERVMELALTVHNGSVSEIRFGDDRLSLSTFNVSCHLKEPGLQTFR